MATSQTTVFKPIAFNPPESYDLAIEVLSMSEFRHRLTGTMHATQRLLFYLMFVVTQGEFVHSVDCITYRCQVNGCILVKPNQIQQFSSQLDSEGWVVMISPEFLQNDSLEEEILVQLPTSFLMSTRAFEICNFHLQSMRDDVRLIAHQTELTHLLRHQLSSLIFRLRHEDELFDPSSDSDDLNATRFKRFRLLLENNFSTKHQVIFYADQLGLSLKTLNRLCLKMVNTSAKVLIADRIILEAKRLLVHTNQSIQLIADTLSFDDVSNFCKVFKANASCTPRQFRTNQKQGFHQLTR